MKQVTCTRWRRFTGENPLQEIRMRLVSLIAILSLVALAGCRDATSPTDSEHVAPLGILSPLALSTTLSSPTLNPGGSIAITITVTNISDAGVTLTDYACNTRFVLRARSGITVVPYRELALCDAVLDVRTLAPHASVSFTQAWDGRVLLNDGTLGQVPGGRYTVFANGIFGSVRSNVGAQLAIGASL